MHVGRRPDRHALGVVLLGRVRSWDSLPSSTSTATLCPTKNAEGAVVGFKEFREVKILAELEANLLRPGTRVRGLPAAGAAAGTETRSPPPGWCQAAFPG